MERRHFVAGSAFGAVASMELHAETSASNARKVRNHMKAFRVAESTRDSFVHAMQAAAPAAPCR
ncbi:MAG TPA: hypothetical protein VEY31_01655 [Roseococcus sp.]|jgi:hypothetical protein|nr:hypothetical protein [Roseococcus sp.]